MDIQFKTIIASSLPCAWDVFTEPYVGRHKGAIENDPKKLSSSQEFIGIIKEEYTGRKSSKPTDITMQVSYAPNNSNNTSQPLANRISEPKKHSSSNEGMQCRNCGFTNHITDNCKWLGMAKCGKCGWFGHSDCEHDALQKKKAERNKPKFKKQKRAQAHQAIEEVQEDDMVFSSTMDVDECNSSSTPQTLAKEGNNIVFGLYDWIADTATTSHITNMQEAFQTFQPLRKYVCYVSLCSGLFWTHMTSL